MTDSDAALVFAGEGWHRGVVGIVASRVVERFHRPAFVLGIGKASRKARGAAFPRFICWRRWSRCRTYSAKFGGHRQAAGVTMDAAMVETFRERLRVYAGERLTPADFERELAIDSRDRM